MAIRRSAVRPDPQTGMVSREAHVQAFMDLEAMMWIAGGVGSVVVDRARTDVPNEMVTTFVVVDWKDRTDAKPSPEPESSDLAPAAGLEGLNPLQVLSEQLGIPVEDLVARIAAQPEQVAVGANGASSDDEPEEDLSSIPESQR